MSSLIFLMKFQSHFHILEDKSVFESLCYSIREHYSIINITDFEPCKQIQQSSHTVPLFQFPVS
jgi:hypothetical protein